MVEVADDVVVELEVVVVDALDDVDEHAVVVVVDGVVVEHDVEELEVVVELVVGVVDDIVVELEVVVVDWCSGCRSCR